MSLASGIVFPVDQATLGNQIVLWDSKECCEDANLDRHLCVRACGHHIEAAGFESQSLHYSANSECDGL